MKKEYKNIIELSTYGLNYEKDNLFDDEYGNFHRSDGIIYEEMKILKNRNLQDCLKLGRNLLELVSDCPSSRNFNIILNHSSVQLGRTQAIKYIECFNYLNEKFQKNQPTEELEELGIEKLYLLSTVKDCLKRVKLETYITDEKLTVKQVSQLITILNNKSEIFKIATKFLKEFEEEYSRRIDPHNPF